MDDGGTKITCNAIARHRNDNASSGDTCTTKLVFTVTFLLFFDTKLYRACFFGLFG